MDITTSYDIGRLVIQSGDIIFVRNGRGFISRTVANIVRFFTKSNYSHAGIAFWIDVYDQKRLMVIEAQGGTKRRIVNISYYEKHNIDVIQRPEQWAQYIPRAIEKLGEARYGWYQAFYVGVREFLLQYFNIKLPAFNLPGEICSEFVADVYDLPEKRVSPQLLFEQLRALGLQERIRIR